MLYYINYTCIDEDDFKDKIGIPLLKNPDSYFDLTLNRWDPYNDKFFVKCLDEIVNCEFISHEVIQHRTKKYTYDAMRTATGVKTVWLAYTYGNKFYVFSHHMGDNCYPTLLNASVDKDMYIYDTSGLASSTIFYNKPNYYITDVITGKVIELSDDNWGEYIARRGYR